MTSKTDTFHLVKLACETADEKLGKDILALDVRRQSSVADAFVFVTCTSHLHIRAVEDALRERLKTEGAHLMRTDGQRGHLWRVLDYGSFLVHIMDQKTREYYSIERLWDQSKTLPVGPTRKPASKPAKRKPSPAKRRAPRPKKKGRR